jgi:hypothetical protein
MHFARFIIFVSSESKDIIHIILPVTYRQIATTLKLLNEMNVIRKNVIGDNLNQLTPWGRDLLEKLTVTQLVKNSPPFMEPEGSLPC